jgi:pyridoxine 4-dehydrogenase
VICKGALPIPGAKNAAQAQENAGALGWRLTDEEVTRLDQTSNTISE